MNKAICIIILIIFGSLTSFSQNKFDYSRVNTNITTGSTFQFLNSGSLFNSFFIPEFNFAAGENLQFNVGFINSFGFSNFEKSFTYSGYRNYLYAQSEYKISQKIILTGDVIFGMDNFIGKNNFSAKSNIKSYSIGTIYKVNENLQFQFNVRQTNSQNHQFENSEMFFNEYGY